MKKEKLINKIINLELEMFQKVRTSQPSLCQEHPHAFKLMREMGFSVLSEETLCSYLDDLITAKRKKKNLLTEKYARMNNIIPPLKNNSIIGDIVHIEKEWMKRLNQRYPNTIKGKITYFENYLSCELETYSDKTLNLYFRDIKKAVESDLNIIEMRYEYLFRKLGYESIQEKENSLKP
ncbi:MAG: DUF4125 family protein [Candidatus Lokiarchaeota archaeon]|nr:DUF4125 family protein [Candidatus Lokiarchaeota archaeon]MBD3340417.1 DUF4125 family protein [Candidatus Lokiarchaeota archaeon]